MSGPKEDWRKLAGVPRRACLDLCTPEELAINDVVDLVERLGAHPMLTKVVIMLGDTRDALADWVDAGRPGGNALVPGGEGGE